MLLPFPGDGSNGRNVLGASGVVRNDIRSSAGYAVYIWHCDASVRNQSQVSLSSDMVFSDGAWLELATVSGSGSSGLTAALTVAV